MIDDLREYNPDGAFHLVTPQGRGLPGWAEARDVSRITRRHIEVWRRWWRAREDQPMFSGHQQGRYLLRQVRWVREDGLIKMSPELLGLQRGARRGLYVPRGVAPVVWGMRPTKRGTESMLMPVARFMVRDLGDEIPGQRYPERW